MAMIACIDNFSLELIHNPNCRLYIQFNLGLHRQSQLNAILTTVITACIDNVKYHLPRKFHFMRA